jgi:hypothetical protein
MAFAVWIALYSLAGGLFMLLYGQYLFFWFPEWQIYGGISLGVVGLAVINVFALSNRSYLWTRVGRTLWPFVIVICTIRAILMIVQLQRGKDKIAWECENGGQLWTASAEAGYTENPTVGIGFCSAGFSTLNTIFIISLLIDITCQLYMFFMTWRFCKRLEHYRQMKGPYQGGYYA